MVDLTYCNIYAYCLHNISCYYKEDYLIISVKVFAMLAGLCSSCGIVACVIFVACIIHCLTNVSLSKTLPDVLAANVKQQLSPDGLTLTLVNLCRDCGVPDLMVISCNASNDYGYAYASGFVNVLSK